MSGTSSLDVSGAEYPPFVSGAEAQVRWDLAVGICAVISGWFEHEGPDRQFYTLAAASLFHSDLTTGPPDPESARRLNELRETLTCS